MQPNVVVWRVRESNEKNAADTSENIQPLPPLYPYMGQNPARFASQTPPIAVMQRMTVYQAR
jgi:hypothetical protein